LEYVVLLLQHVLERYGECIVYSSSVGEPLLGKG